MKDIRKHFEEEAKEFDTIIQQLIPWYSDMIDSLVAAIPFNKSDPINVIDLGCGTGTISNQIKTQFPNAHITCLDLAENMIEMSKLKLSEYSDIQYEVADFNSYEFHSSYDVVVSSLALHHLETDQDKINYYGKIYDALRPNGVFFNADVVLGSTDALQNMYMEKWKSFMLRSVSQQEIDEKWIPKYYEEDRPAKLIDQINWLDNIGFNAVDVVWKYYNFAVYGGQKQDK